MNIRSTLIAAAICRRPASPPPAAPSRAARQSVGAYVDDTAITTR